MAKLRSKMKLNTTPFSRRLESAFTLAEALIGAMIVLILFLSLYAGISSSFLSTKMARENLRATQIMLERMEGIRLYNWNQLIYSNWIPGTFTDYYYPLAGSNQSAGIPYRGEFGVSNVTFTGTAPNYAGDLRMVVVRVYWTNTIGKDSFTRTRTMRSLVGKNGLQNYIYYN